tara:strand:+ start:20805 stop:21188 length:384 start_codon:yes stop_codon:yes gene_type:complete
MKNVIAGLAIALTLTACEVSMGGVTPNQRFTQPYTAEELKSAEAYVSEVVLKSWSDMKSRSLSTVYGRTTPNGDGTYKIEIADYLSERGTKEITEHEMGHVYRLAILGATMEDEAAHNGPWKVNLRK